VAGNITFTLPTGAGSANQLLKNGATAGSLAFGTATEDASGNLAFNSGYGSSAVAYGCRAWVNFNGTGTVAIRASGNVSSITDNGTGNYTVNFTTTMVDANYSAVITPCRNVAGDTNMQAGVLGQTGFATGSVRLQTLVASSSANEDAFAVSVAIFR
jgi:uncharacterized protein (AIM24 family)